MNVNSTEPINRSKSIQIARWKWFAPPPEAMSANSRAARNAYYIIAISFPITLILPLYAFWLNPEENVDGFIIGSVMTVMFGLFFVLLQRGYLRFVCHGIVITCIISVSCALLLNGGIRDIIVMLVPVVLLFTNALLGGRAIFIYGTIVVLMVFGIYWVEATHWIAPRYGEEVTLDSLVLVLTTIVITIFYLYITFTQIVRNANQIQEQSISLTETIGKLQTIRSSLEQRTAELSVANEHLIATQRQLAEAEKMAALGNLVAGIAHEINTPLGIGITAATTLMTMTEDLGANYRNNAFRRSYFEAYLHDALTGNRLIVNNLLRVDQLVQNFKQLSSEQFTSDRCRFHLKAHLTEIIQNIEPHLRSGQHRVELFIDDSLYLDSYPGAVTQVITNLLMNSLIHGYHNRSNGQIRIVADVYNQYIRLIYIDDGSGIAQEHRDKIYEPFFTTARDRGGTGLGLHIVYNLVTQKLGGTIRHESETNAGVIFSLELPLYLEEEEKFE